MQITSKFTIAVHTLLCINRFSNETKVTSNFIANSVNVNPVIIRNILGELKSADLVNVEAGVGGATIKKELSKITLLDVFNAVNSLDGNLFSFHDNPNKECPVGNNIHNILDKRLDVAQKAMENELSKVTLQMLVDDLEKAENDNMNNFINNFI